VEMMRKGMSPTEACMEACRRVSKSYNDNREKLKKFSINFYALNKNGVYGGAALFGSSELNAQGRRQRNQFAVHDGNENKLHDLAFLYEMPDK
jgi:N4-(beta-N-acetylglucosaminyl)-L-asparaginase